MRRGFPMVPSVVAALARVIECIRDTPSIPTCTRYIVRAITFGVTLSEYLKREGKGAKSRLQRKTGLAYSTIHWIATGATVARPDTAKKIEKATGGAVTAAEILGVEAA